MLYGALCSALHMVLLEFGVLGNKGFIVGILAGFGQSRSGVSWHQPARIRNTPSKYFLCFKSTSPHTAETHQNQQLWQ